MPVHTHLRKFYDVCLEAFLLPPVLPVDASTLSILTSGNSLLTADITAIS